MIELMRQTLKTAITEAITGMSDAALLDMMKDPLKELAKAQCQPLTQAQIEAGRRASWGFNSDYFTAGVRFAEATHGIKKE
jgi:hypothetical protein